jgi:hypothetical protein
MYNLVENANVVQIYIVDSTFVLKYGCTQLQVNIGVLLLCNFVLLLRIIIFFCAENIFVDEQMQQVLPGKQKRLTLSIIYNIIKLVKLNLRVNYEKVISEKLRKNNIFSAQKKIIMRKSNTKVCQVKLVASVHQRGGGGSGLLTCRICLYFKYFYNKTSTICILFNVCC